ncbi:MAG TPA: phosphoribosylformylglycinamidine synthase subunit PurL [Dehalococcoidia bacterium]|nr:phosphoribosylformylglycinamidine synthase subunit PurL [Dehalococcoidia bacterium]
MPVEQEVLDLIALSRSEYELIVQRLGREPNDVELGMFGALWSEHCGYKNSKPLLRLLPSEGPLVLTRQGAENAGAIDVGDGLCVVMKIESHNHPSAIEPYEGAATGVGGIVRDIFAMGARPIAILDALRFGPLSEPRSRYLFGGVVSGISGYGNCLGIPTVGGEAYFDEAYSANPLVNAMCVGLARTDRLVSARASGEGSLLMLVGADTGRDGLHGASGLASRSDPHARFDELRPAVQVGNPFLEKLLMEACLDLAENHLEWIVGIQDLGAAGLTSACVESAARGNAGVIIDVARVPRREQGMTPYEVMLSESQERMLIIVRKGREGEVAALFERWEVPWAIIGEVTNDSLVRVRDGEHEVAALPVNLLTQPPLYTRDGQPPAVLGELHGFDLDSLPDVQDAGAVLLRLLSSSNIASKRWIYRQYDQSVLTNTIVEAGADAAVLRLKGTAKAIALTTDCNGRYCYLDPYQGARMAVAEAARNLISVGARPVAVTDCLNFGNPERPEVYWQLQEAVRGLAEACRALGTPVISGNVSLYNETEERAVFPTPVIGMLGLIEDALKCLRPGSTRQGDAVLLVGSGLAASAASLAGSEYIRLAHGLLAGRPSIDLELEVRVQQFVLGAIQEGLLSAAHDCSEGGLGVALAELCLREDKGLDARALDLPGRLDAALFGEAPSRFLVACPSDRVTGLLERAASLDVPVVQLGQLSGQRLRLGMVIDLSLDELRDAYEGGLALGLKGDIPQP